jgi:hypothetical protein
VWTASFYPQISSLVSVQQLGNFQVLPSISSISNLLIQFNSLDTHDVISVRMFEQEYARVEKPFEMKPESMDPFASK